MEEKTEKLFSVPLGLPLKTRAPEPHASPTTRS